MKSTFAVFIAVLLAVPTMTKAVTIDGTADAQYGSAIVSQQLGTSTYKNTETNIDAAGGSELDAAYGFVSNGVLYLVMAGNLDSGGADSLENPYDKFNIFLMTGPGGDNVLSGYYSGSVDFGHFNRLGTGGADLADGSPGLKFDAGFAPTYWIGATIGGAGAGPTLYLNYAQICSNCPGQFLGSVNPSNAPPGNIFVDPTFGIQAAINNSNTNGVEAGTCSAQGAPFNPQAVKTGLELAIPLTAIGNPTGQVSICAFITDDPYETMYNQVLAPINGGTLECQDSFGSADSVDFSTLPGTHTFTFTVPPCNAILVNPTSASFSSSVATSTVSVAESGTCPWTATSSSPFLTIVSGGSGSGNGTITYAVSTNTSVDTRTGILTVGGQFATNTVTISQTGVLLPPLGSIIIDGVAEPAYGCPVAVQQLATQFGKNLSTNLVNNGGGTLQGGGSELDAAYGLVLNNVLYLTLAGNLQNNGNEVMIFFMTGPGGQNTLTNVNPNIGGLNSSGPTNGYGPGLTFDPGFAPNYWMGANASGASFFIDYAQLWPGSTNALGVATNGYYLGTTSTTNGTLAGGTNPFLIQATLNDSNTNGVSGGTCTTNAVGAAQTIAAAQVRSGLEFAIPLGAIGSPTGKVAICAYITGSGNHTYLSNQILGPIGSNDPSVVVCQANFGPVTNSPAINFGTLPGQHFFYVGPEVRVTSVAVTNKNVNISYLTEANTNLLYRVERTLGNLATNSVWTPISAFTNGTGGIITQTDTLGGTNKPDALYRIRQTPQCQ